MVPKESSKPDRKCELGIVIGKRSRYLAKDKAKDAAGSPADFIGNDDN